MGEEYSIINREMMEGSFKHGGKTRMMPIQKLLDRIRWDREFGRGDFEIGYDDHMEQEILRIPLWKIKFRTGTTFHSRSRIQKASCIRSPFTVSVKSTRRAVSSGRGPLPAQLEKKLG